MAVCSEAGQIGGAVQTHQFGVGRIVPWVEAGMGAVATQAQANTALGPEGPGRLPEAPHVVGDGFTAHANMMLAPGVAEEMAAVFVQSAGPLWERLLAALDAAERLGGDIRGRQSAARDARCRDGVRVNRIAPNHIENPSDFPPETIADPRLQTALQREVPAQRLGAGAEAADVLWWLASEGASYLFGAVIPTDGGWTL